MSVFYCHECCNYIDSDYIECFEYPEKLKTKQNKFDLVCIGCMENLVQPDEELKKKFENMEL